MLDAAFEVSQRRRRIGEQPSPEEAVVKKMAMVMVMVMVMVMRMNALPLHLQSHPIRSHWPTHSTQGYTQ